MLFNILEKGFVFVVKGFWLLLLLFKNPPFWLLELLELFVLKILNPLLFWLELLFMNGLFTVVLLLFERKGFLLLLLVDRKFVVLLIPLELLLLKLKGVLVLKEEDKNGLLLFWLGNLLLLTELILVKGLLIFE